MAKRTQTIRRQKSQKLHRKRQSHFNKEINNTKCMFKV